MSFKFSASQVDFGYKGEQYSIAINARLAADVEIYLGTHPVNLMQKIIASENKGELPPLGQMASFFCFMLKRAGARNIDQDEIYGELFGEDYSSQIGEAIGNLLAVFVPHQEAVSDPKSKARTKKN